MILMHYLTNGMRGGCQGIGRILNGYSCSTLPVGTQSGDADTVRESMSYKPPDTAGYAPMRNDKLIGHSETLGWVGSWQLTVASRELEWSDGMYRIHGVMPGDNAFTVQGMMGHVHPDDLDAANQAIDNAIAQGVSGTSKQRIVCADGSERHVLLYFEGQYSASGEVTHILGAMQDITAIHEVEEEQRLLESKVQQAQKLESLGVLAGGIAHDFNNLLMGILGNADLALMDLAPESPARQSIMGIETAAKRAADLARQMLAYSGKGKFLVKRLDLGVLIGEMKHLIKTSVSKKVVIKYEFSNDVQPIEADAAQVRQVVMNLINNASEAIGDKSGVIVIRAGSKKCSSAYLSELYLDADLEEGLYSFVEVSDTGVGMDQETLSKIFDPFYTTKFTGRGLGLAAVLGIVRGHRAAIKVYSKPKRALPSKCSFQPIPGPYRRSRLRLPLRSLSSFVRSVSS